MQTRLAVKASASKADGNKELANKELFMALGLTFLFHGCWDAALDIAEYMIERPEFALQMAGMVMALALVAFGIFYSVKTIKYVRKLAREDKTCL